MPRSIVLAAALISCSCQHIGGPKKVAEKVQPTLASLEQNLAVERAMIVATLSNPAALAAKLVKTIASPPFGAVRQKNQDVAALLTPEGRAKAWGFDPATFSGWQSIGIDPRAGFALGVLSSPWRAVIAVKIDRPSRFVAFLNERFGKGKELFTIKEHPDGSNELRRKEESFVRWDWVDGLAWLTFGNKSDDVAGYSLRKPEEPALATSAEYQRLKPEGEQQSQLRFMPSAMPEDAQRAMQLQPGELRRYIEGFVWSLNDDRSRSRVLLGEKGLAGVSGIFGADRAPAKVSGRVLNDDHLTLRLRLNLATLFDGVLALIPERLKDKASQPIGHAQGLLMLAGNASKLGWPGLAEAINGDLTVAFPKRNLADAPRVIPWTGLVAILAGNQAKAIVKMLEGFSPTLVKQFGAKPLNLKGHMGFFLKPGSKRGVYLMAVDDGLLLALDQQSLAYFLALPAQEPSGPLTDKKMVYGYHFPATLETEAKGSASTTKASSGFTGLPTAVSGAARLVGASIIDEQPGSMALAVLGLVAAVGIPNFIRFTCRAKQAEAKSNLRGYATAQMAYSAEFDAYGSIKESGWLPLKTVRYHYCASPDDCLPCTGQCYGVSLDEAKAACVKAGVMRSEGAVPDKQFVGCAVGRLQAGGPLDLWTIDANRRLNHQHNACR